MPTQKENNQVRSGSVVTRKGVLATPFFMPDATRAAVRGVTPDEITAAGIGALVVNTYHLMLQPGAKLIARSGGIHAFMGWDGPVLSDSGGYQVYSLIHKHPEMGRITEEGAEFKSVYDGTKHLLTPEESIRIQFDLGVDMMVCLDDPRPNDAPEEEISAAVDRTVRWAARCKVEFERQVAARGLAATEQPLLFAVVQGGMIVEERCRCARELSAIGFDGYGFGGRHVDGEGNFLEAIVRETANAIPNDTPRFALGVGTPEDIVRCHMLGWDMFDCVIPTREGRHGRLFMMCGVIPGLTRDPDSGSPACQRGREAGMTTQSFSQTINITNEQYKEDFTPVDPTCGCPLCKNHTKSYLRHLFRVGDPLAGRLATLHNLRFYGRLLARLRGE